MKKILSYILAAGISTYVVLAPQDSYPTSVPNFPRKSTIERKHFRNPFYDDNAVVVEATEGKPTLELGLDSWQGDIKPSRLERNQNTFKPSFMPKREIKK